MDHLLVSLIASVVLEVVQLSGLTYLLEADPPNLRLLKNWAIPSLFFFIFVFSEKQLTDKHSK